MRFPDLLKEWAAGQAKSRTQNPRLPIQSTFWCPGAISCASSKPHEWQFPAALYSYHRVVPGSLRNTYPKNVTILYLVSSSYSTFTPLSVIWFTLSLEKKKKKKTQQIRSREEFPHANAILKWREIDAFLLRSGIKQTFLLATSLQCYTGNPS